MDRVLAAEREAQEQIQACHTEADYEPARSAAVVEAARRLAQRLTSRDHDDE